MSVTSTAIPATPAEYARLPRWIQSNLPDDVKARIRAAIDLDLIRGIAEHHRDEQARYQALTAPVPTAPTRVRAKLSPVSPMRDSHREKRGQHLGRNPSKPCPNARHLGLRDPHGHLRTVSVPCRRKSCPVCGAHWAALATEGIGYRVEEHNGRFETVTIGHDTRERWKKALQRARKAGRTIDGVSIPVGIDGTTVILLARTDDSDICKSIPAAPVAAPTQFAELALQGALRAAVEWDDIPPQHRPAELGKVHGIGTWRGRITPNLGEEPESSCTVAYEFVDLPDQAELIRMAREAGLYARKLPGEGLELIEPANAPGAEERLIRRLNVIANTPDPPF